MDYLLNSVIVTRGHYHFIGEFPKLWFWTPSGSLSAHMSLWSKVEEGKGGNKKFILVVKI